MKTTLMVAAMAALFISETALAQKTNPSSTAPPSASAQTQPKIAPGSVIPVELTKTIDAKKARTGDEVVAKVTQDMKTQTGEILFPKDTKVIGHVTEAQRREKDQKESQLAIAFDQAVLKNQQVQLPMLIQAVIGPQNNSGTGAGQSGAPGNSPVPSSTGTTASSPMAGRSPMGNGGQPQPQISAPTGDSNGAPQSNWPPINAQTQGVVGISNLNLSPNSNAKQGTVLTSEKNNVKLESGTMLLLRVE